MSIFLYEFSAYPELADDATGAITFIVSKISTNFGTTREARVRRTADFGGFFLLQHLRYPDGIIEMPEIGAWTHWPHGEIAYMTMLDEEIPNGDNSSDGSSLPHRIGHKGQPPSLDAANPFWPSYRLHLLPILNTSNIQAFRVHVLYTRIRQRTRTTSRRENCVLSSPANTQVKERDVTRVTNPVTRNIMDIVHVHTHRRKEEVMSTS